MKALSAAQMREADRRCIEEIGIPGVVLMNNAGFAVYKHVQGESLSVVCGKGNNGGDGYVIARYALLDGMKTKVFVLAQYGEITGDARIFLDAYINLGGEVEYVLDEKTAQSALIELQEYKCLVDAMLGTGVHGEVRGLTKIFIEGWPEKYTLAVDLPSGMNADTGEVCGCCIRADKTVTLQCAKTGMLQLKANRYFGELVIEDIGIPEICCSDEAWTAFRNRS